LDPHKHREIIESVARQTGIVLFGVADLKEISDASGDVSLNGLTTGIIFGYRLNDVVLDGIVDHPTRTYQYHYRQVNLLLDHVGLRIASYIQELGFRVFPVPSSQVVDWDSLAGHVSHRAIGRLAGLGWIGKNNLLVNPVYGSRARYASVLTDMDLPYGGPIEGDCGACRRCSVSCPGRAIGEDRSDFDLAKCKETIDRVRKIANIGSHICGICVKACKGPAGPAAGNRG
jgi:epoxyqueuosine reductase QueG